MPVGSAISSYEAFRPSPSDLRAEADDDELDDSNEEISVDTYGQGLRAESWLPDVSIGKGGEGIRIAAR